MRNVTGKAKGQKTNAARELRSELAALGEMAEELARKHRTDIEVQALAGVIRTAAAFGSAQHFREWRLNIAASFPEVVDDKTITTTDAIVTIHVGT